MRAKNKVLEKSYRIRRLNHGRVGSAIEKYVKQFVLKLSKYHLFVLSSPIHISSFKADRNQIPVKPCASHFFFFFPSKSGS